MLLYLIQHGDAKPEDEDPDRPLTDQGKREVESVMLLLMRYGAVTAARVVHSGKRRAEETAEIVAMKLDADVVVDEDLAPRSDPAIWAARLAEVPGDVVLVGHLPHLQRLAGLLLAGDPKRAAVRFENGGVVCLGTEDDGGWSLRWAITPSLVSE